MLAPDEHHHQQQQQPPEQPHHTPPLPLVISVPDESQPGFINESTLDHEIPLTPPPFHKNDSNKQSFMSTMTDRLHKMPRWKYRLLCGSLAGTLLLLVLLIVVSIVYGFNLKYVHISVTSTEPLLPATLVDPQGNVPLRAMLSLDNPNRFPIAAGRSQVALSFLHKANGTREVFPLTTAPIAPVFLHAREREHALASEFVLQNIAHMPGGPALMGAVLKGRATYFLADLTLPLRVQALGFVPVVRQFKVACTIATLWGEPLASGANGTAAKESISDCFGRFV